MSTDAEIFHNALNSFIEGLWPIACPHKIIEFNDNVSTITKYSALVLVWVGTVDNAIVKKVYKVWYDTGIIKKAEIARVEWPAEI